MSNQEKTEQATPKRREDSRKKGQVARSREIPSAFLLLGALGVFFWSGSWMCGQLVDIMRSIFQNLDTVAIGEAGTAPGLMLEIFKLVTVILAPLLLTMVLIGLGTNVLQVGFMASAESLTPQFSRLDPLKGIKKIFALRSIVEVIKSLLKIALVGTIGYLVLRRELETVPQLIHMAVGDIGGFIATVAFKICFCVCLALILLAALDYGYQRWQHEKDMRMTKQEVKEENKQREGDPQIKSKIRAIQMEMSRQRMMADVPDATVVVTNPTHLAIALTFETDNMAAPKVVAKGAGFVAARIREIARQHNVPLVENKPLARTLYKTTDIGHFIPIDLYHAVAEILAYVYRLQGRVR
jgi:flagellar biosynthesis protein FlhB